MGSYDGAETCELVGSFLLSQLQKKLGQNIGLYRDDGLAITDATPKATENIKKDICRIFKDNGLRITIEANKQTINFLDVTFNLTKNSYQPYTKPNTTLQYVHQESNHPPITLKNIPAGINKRLSSLSSDKNSFDQAAPPYQKALHDSGYQYNLCYEPTAPARRKNRQRNDILWYNPPFSKNVSTNIGRKFLGLIDKHFAKDNKLRKIFNRNTIKISYSCMNNTKQIIDNHNKRILKSSEHNDTPTSKTKDNKTCNCRQKDACPLDGNCLQPSVIYQATVTSKDNPTPETYIGLTENEFKTRYQKPHRIIPAHTLQKLYRTQQTHLEPEGQQHRLLNLLAYFVIHQSLQQRKQTMQSLPEREAFNHLPPRHFYT